MDRVVVDSSVAVKWLLPEQHSAEAARLLDECRAGNLELLAPDLINAEVGNVLWKRHKFHGLAKEDVEPLVTAFQALPIAFTTA